MKRLLALFLLLPTLALAQTGVRLDRPIISKLDLDTPTVTATTNYIVTSANVVNSTYTLAHQPDTPRNITGTVTDTTPSVVGGTITIVGTDVNGSAQSEVWTLTSLTFTGTKIFATITTITGASITVLGGAGDETVVMGVGSTVAYRYCSLSDPREGSLRATTSGSSATVTSTSGTPFSDVAVGDELTFTNVNNQYTRVITAKASGASITVDSAVNLSATNSYAWTYRTLTCGYGNNTGWLPLRLGSYSLGLFVRQQTDTGGVAYSIEGRQRGSLSMPIQLYSGTLSGQASIPGVPIGSTAGNVISIADDVSEVRLGLKFVTTDDSSDTGTEMIDAVLTAQEKR